MKLAEKIDDINPSATLEITAKAKMLKSEGVNVISLAAGEPDFDTPGHIKEAAIKAINEGFTRYTPTSGTHELKKAIAQKLMKENQLKYDTNQVIVSCGAKHSLYNIFQVLCQKGEEVILPSPYWVSYPEMIKLAEATPVIVKTEQDNDFKLTREQLASKITSKTKAIILNSPSNPTGSVYQKEELKTIADIAASKGIWVISDEIYERLLYDGLSHISIASINQSIYDLTILVNGVSKTYAMTGWRIGYLAGPKEIASAVSKLQDHSTSCPSSISQKAALAALEGDQGFITGTVSEFQKRRNYMVKKLNTLRGISCNSPKGAFYIFCDISQTGLDSMTFCKRLLEEVNVATIPGQAFGCPTHIRLSFATDLSNITEGLNRIEDFLKRLH